MLIYTDLVKSILAIGMRAVCHTSVFAVTQAKFYIENILCGVILKFGVICQTQYSSREWGGFSVKRALVYSLVV